MPCCMRNGCFGRMSASTKRHLSFSLFVLTPGDLRSTCRINHFIDQRKNNTSIPEWESRTTDAYVSAYQKRQQAVLPGFHFIPKIQVNHDYLSTSNNITVAKDPYRKSTHHHPKAKKSHISIKTKQNEK
ncbi:hypothetical protein BDV28DRAFT_17197 [Aspergillus coremiiformis]|uniref:Uncharacterized protein n=1 Tax=Aspergillus coremiiformis TaxID=138285 RepID=A0A5N6Z1S6_9EURO|nr:hypothetical protein BDV28DRAFT_17197 [Aspergillus coremiiformis]